MGERQEPLDHAFHALAHPIRRALLERLRAGSACVTELAEPFPISLNTVSKHLRVLERARLVRRTVEGREHRLRLSPGPLREAAAFVARYEAFWSERLDALDDVLTKRKRAQKERES
jgi:DNA-binding transcriptional ArsR family regulator